MSKMRYPNRGGGGMNVRGPYRKARRGDFGPGAGSRSEPVPGCWIGHQYFADDDYVGIELALKLNGHEIDPALARAAESQREQSGLAARQGMRDLGWKECQRLANIQTFRDARIIMLQEAIFRREVRTEIEQGIGARERAIRQRNATTSWRRIVLWTPSTGSMDR
jgi:hypothetical protein